MRLSDVELARHMKTYTIAAPVATHYRAASCTEFECAAQRSGWVSHIDERTDLGRKQAMYIRGRSGRKFTESASATYPGVTEFRFFPDQDCFAAHQVPLDRPAHFLVRAGNAAHRGALIRRHTSAESWMDDLHATTDAVQSAKDKG